MLESVLLIGKIAGIIALSILGALIVIVVFLLLAPVKYWGEISTFDEADGEKKPFHAKFRAKLLPVQVYAVYEEGFRAWVKIGWFTVFDTEHEKHAPGDGGKDGKKRKKG